MTGLPITRLTPEEFLEKERAAEEKHEYWYGEVFAMAAGSPPHSFVINNVQTTLTNLLRGGSCYVFNADLRVVVRWDELITYPDVTVLCGKPEYADDRRDTLTPPHGSRSPVALNAQIRPWRQSFPLSPGVLHARNSPRGAGAHHD